MINKLNTHKQQGFTLIGLCVILVMIGLLAGAVMIGKYMVQASNMRGQIAQIERYNQAVNSFRTKFGALPGDMPAATANQYGFTVGSACNGNRGSRDGNGLIEGYIAPATFDQTTGETALFWQDLTSAFADSRLGEAYGDSGNGKPIRCQLNQRWSTADISVYFPIARIGLGDFLYVYSVNGANWYGLSTINSIGWGTLNSTANIPVKQAYAMDAKMDDGVPTTGHVQANYLNGSAKALYTAPNTAAAGGDSASCYDTTTNAYSTRYNGGSGENCALSFQFQ